MLQIRLFICHQLLSTYELVKNSYTIGRNGDFKISPEGLTEEDWRTISRIHCTIIAVYPTYLVVDGNNQGKHSDNGITINGQKSRAAMLRPGDIVALSAKVYFEISSDQPVEFGNSDDTQTNQ